MSFRHEEHLLRPAQLRGTVNIPNQNFSFTNQTSRLSIMRPLRPRALSFLVRFRSTSTTTSARPITTGPTCDGMGTSCDGARLAPRYVSNLCSTSSRVNYSSKAIETRDEHKIWRNLQQPDSTEISGESDSAFLWSLSLPSEESGMCTRKSMPLMRGDLRHGCAMRQGNVVFPHACISAYACSKYYDSCSSCNV